MQVEPIINARFKQFRQKNELESIQDSLAFEKFVNYTIYTLHYPDAFTADSELLDFVSVGGSNDMGIDSILLTFIILTHCVYLITYNGFQPGARRLIRVNVCRLRLFDVIARL
jgi:hypothetical protein